MTIESLNRALHARPFRSFRFQLADGRALPVPHPEFLAFNGHGRTAIVIDDKDGFEIVDLLLVVSLAYEGEMADPRE